MEEIVFCAFKIVPSSNLMYVLISDVTLSLKWLTVTLKIQSVYTHGRNYFLAVSDGAQLKCHVHFDQ